MSLWFSLLYQPLVNLLILFYQLLGQNLGAAIIGLTLAVRGLLLPLTLPSIRAAQKMRTLNPQLAKLKKKHGEDKQALTKAQMKLYQKHGLNPAAGCLPQIIQIIILIALFQAFNQVLRADGEVAVKLNQVLYSRLQLAEETTINSRFFYLDLTKPDLLEVKNWRLAGLEINRLPGLFLIAAAVSQFISSKIMMSGAAAAQAKAKKTKGQEDDLAAMMQKQMLYMMPLMTLLIGFKFPSGLVLYWLTFSLFMLVQNWLIKKE